MQVHANQFLGTQIFGLLRGGREHFTQTPKFGSKIVFLFVFCFKKTMHHDHVIGRTSMHLQKYALS